MDVIPSHVHSVGGEVGAEVEMIDFGKREERMREVLAPLKKAYQYISIILDCAPSQGQGLSTINAWTAAASLIVTIIAVLVLITVQCE